jgi:hypothetical protein
MVVRLAGGFVGPHALPADVRRARAAAAKGWLIALAVPTKLRAAFTRALGSSAEEDRGALADALEGVTDITAPHLDRMSRSELTRVVTALRSATVPTVLPLAGAVDRPVA